MQYIFIINPKAGKGKYHKITSEIKRICESKKDINYKIEFTKSANHATIISNKYAKIKDEKIRIYAAGGDGTLNEVCKGVLKEKNHDNISVGVIPIGSGNDFSRNILSNLQKNIEAQLSAQEVVVDVLKVAINGDSYFSINAITVGLDSKIAIQVDKFKRIPFMSGSAAYITSIIMNAKNMTKTLNLEIELDNEIFNDEYLLALNANGAYYGGGFNGAPLAKLDDGLIDIITITKIPLLKLPKLLLAYQKGKHRDSNDKDLSKYIVYKKSKKIKITSTTTMAITIDGEGMYAKKIEMEVLPKRLNFLIP